MVSDTEVEKQLESKTTKVNIKFPIRRQSKARMIKSQSTLNYYNRRFAEDPNYVPRKGINLSKDRTKILPGPIRKNKKVQPKKHTKHTERIKKEVKLTTVRTRSMRTNATNTNSLANQSADYALMEKEQFFRPTLQHDDLLLNEENLDNHKNQKIAVEEESRDSETVESFHDDDSSMEFNDKSTSSNFINSGKGHIIFNAMEGMKTDCNNIGKDKLHGKNDTTQIGNVQVPNENVSSPVKDVFPTLISQQAAQLFLCSDSNDSVDTNDDEPSANSAMMHFAETYCENVTSFQHLLEENDINDMYVDELQR